MKRIIEVKYDTVCAVEGGKWIPGSVIKLVYVESEFERVGEKIERVEKIGVFEIYANLDEINSLSDLFRRVHDTTLKDVKKEKEADAG